MGKEDFSLDNDELDEDVDLDSNKAELSETDQAKRKQEARRLLEQRMEEKRLKDSLSDYFDD